MLKKRIFIKKLSLIEHGWAKYIVHPEGTGK